MCSPLLTHAPQKAYTLSNESYISYSEEMQTLLNIFYTTCSLLMLESTRILEPDSRFSPLPPSATPAGLFFTLLSMSDFNVRNNRSKSFRYLLPSLISISSLLYSSSSSVIGSVHTYILISKSPRLFLVQHSKYFHHLCSTGMQSLSFCPSRRRLVS